jgi:HEAT repeat protein
LGPFGEPTFWEQVIPPLERCAEHPRWRIRKKALDAMVRLGTTEVIPILKRLAKSDRARERAAAVSWLAAFEYNRWDDDKLTAAGVGAIVEALEDEHPAVRRRAAKCLYNVGKTGPAETVVPALRAAMKDPEPAVRAEALQALVNVDREKPETALLLGELFSDPHAKVRKAAVGWISSCGTNAIPVLPALMERFDDPSPGVRDKIMWTCKYLGSFTVPYLLECLKHPSARVRYHAALAFREQDQ